ncbi:NAD(P)H-binding protein [Nocardia grenadensis]|uniref:NAD(P)H-binding protein n=1 Tax=Nocardia grenadensis TaxID=931537 RepID=UPI0007A4D24B|nr:NAD(P)H-binding protein [Nocardia grenadensis]
MKIVVVGAAGMVGSRVVAEAAHRGHDPVAVFRNGRPVLLPPGVVAVQGDANDRSRISEISAGADAVVVATRPVPGQEHTVAASTHTLLRQQRSRALR